MLRSAAAPQGYPFEKVGAGGLQPHQRRPRHQQRHQHHRYGADGENSKPLLVFVFLGQFPKTLLHSVANGIHTLVVVIILGAQVLLGHGALGAYQGEHEAAGDEQTCDQSGYHARHLPAEVALGEGSAVRGMDGLHGWLGGAGGRG